MERGDGFVMLLLLTLGIARSRVKHATAGVLKHVRDPQAAVGHAVVAAHKNALSCLLGIADRHLLLMEAANKNSIRRQRTPVGSGAPDKTGHSVSTGAPDNVTGQRRRVAALSRR